MEKYERIIKHLESVTDWKNEELFLLDVIALGSSKLFLKAHQDLRLNNFVTILPWLRQIQENLIIMIGLTEDVYTLSEFSKEKFEPLSIMNRIKDRKYNDNMEEFDQINNYFRGIKEMLNKYAHSNLDGAMMLFTERFQVHESVAFTKLMINFLMVSLERPFLAIINGVYNLNIELTPVINLEKELKNIGTLKYIDRDFPASIKQFINNSESLKNYFVNVVKDIRTKTKDLLKDIKKN